MMKNNQDWDYIITSKRPWFNLELKNIWIYRDLISFFIRRDLLTEYKQTILGVLYYIINPVFSTLIKIIIFSKIAKLSTDGIPDFLFYLSGGILWSYFAKCKGIGTGVFLSNKELYSQVYFPRLAIPIANNISELIRLSIQMLLFFGFYIYFKISGSDIYPSLGLILLPLLFLQCSLLGFGFGLMLSSLTTRYRDLNFLGGYINSFWMYASPIVYPLSVIPEKWHYILSFNPMVGVVELSRYFLFGQSSFNIEQLTNGMVTTFIILIIGLSLFSRTEKFFLDTV